MLFKIHIFKSVILIVETSTLEKRGGTEKPYE